MSMLTRDDIRLAAQRVSPYIRLTPILRLDRQSFDFPGEIYLKLELLQATGSFKPRGAFNFLLSGPIPAAGVITASGGNHGAAVAYAARVLGARAEVYVPGLAPPIKRQMLTRFGAQTIVAGATYVEALAASQARAAESGALAVPAFDHPATVAGQGTIASELQAQVPEVDTVIVAVGGGGLISGVAAWFGEDAKVVAAEPVLCPTYHAALEAGRPVDVATGGIAADALGCRRIGALPFSILHPLVREAVLVTEQQILDAQKALWEQFRIVAEPGGAVAFAALISGAYRPAPGENVVVILCGGNVDPRMLATEPAAPVPG
ncbi:threonine/serine dehydratase [Ralstonia solanacearum]|uniref:Threonine/serine dehydratase n=1 Tax=Ralstonia solanacearum TaxID=305 RepID=A0AAD0WID7_RALSL|nr:threonine/serine dehydratase [Ralstonia solanacearum]AXV84035.1 threonine/serine dehydratase [Ralstonia solanacearum]AXW55165.1 threonine/serine dehydratase [Ralstonia solanacearum]CBJ35322.1 putative threonine dehydratase [Ralstonia solanacearum PSI07]